MNTQSLLSIEDLSIRFAQYESAFSRRLFWAIEALSLELFPGEVLAVVGASGSGKSLLAHAVLDILPQNAHATGKIHYKGAPLLPRRIQQLRGKEIALIPQSVSYLDPLMRVGQQLLKGAHGKNSILEAAQILARFNLPPETADLFPHELSGGMARRVLIATAVAGNPKLIIADEPTPGLDEPLAMEMLSMLRQLADSGAGILLITHDLELMQGVADRIVVFHSGRTLEGLPATDFFAGTGILHPYTAALYNALGAAGGGRYEPVR